MNTVMPTIHASLETPLIMKPSTFMTRTIRTEYYPTSTISPARENPLAPYALASGIIFAEPFVSVQSAASSKSAANENPLALYIPPAGLSPEVLVISCDSPWSGDKHSLCPVVQNQIHEDAPSHQDLVKRAIHTSSAASSTNDFGDTLDIHNACDDHDHDPKAQAICNSTRLSFFAKLLRTSTGFFEAIGPVLLAVGGTLFVLCLWAILLMSIVAMVNRANEEALAGAGSDGEREGLCEDLESIACRRRNGGEWCWGGMDRGFVDKWK